MKLCCGGAKKGLEFVFWLMFGYFCIVKEEGRKRFRSRGPFVRSRFVEGGRLLNNKKDDMYLSFVMSRRICVRNFLLAIVMLISP